MNYDIITCARTPTTSRPPLVSTRCRPIRVTALKAGTRHPATGTRIFLSDDTSTDTDPKSIIHRIINERLLGNIGIYILYFFSFAYYNIQSQRISGNYEILRATVGPGENENGGEENFPLNVGRFETSVIHRVIGGHGRDREKYIPRRFAIITAGAVINLSNILILINIKIQQGNSITNDNDERIRTVIREHNQPTTDHRQQFLLPSILPNCCCHPCL